MKKYIVAVLLAWFQSACMVSTDTVAGLRGIKAIPVKMAHRVALGRLG